MQTDPRIPESIESPLRSLVRQADAHNEAQRLSLFLKAQRNDLYYRGITRVAPVLAGDRIALQRVEMSESSGEPFREYTVNRIRGDGRKLISILGQKHPNVSAVADDPRQEADRAAAREYDRAAAVIRSWVDVEALQMRAVLYQFKYGTVFGYTRWVADGERYGWREEPVLEPQEQILEPGSYQCPVCGAAGQADTMPSACPACGAPSDPAGWTPPETALVPVEVGSRKYPNGRVEVTLANVLSVRVPFEAETIKDCDYLIYERELPRHRVLASYPGVREKIGSSTGASSQGAGRTARLSVSSPDGVRQANGDMVTVTEAWIRPVLYEAIADDAARTQVQQAFPSGVKVTMVDDHVVDAAESKMDDHWAACPAQVSDNIYSDPLCDDMIDYQDAFTDAMTIAMETLERGLPLSLFSPDIIDPKVLSSRTASPAEMLPARPGSGGNLAGAVVTVPTARFPEQLPELVGLFGEAVRDSTGIRPELWGGGDAGGTATEYVRRQNQALAQLGMQWVFLRDFWVEIYEDAVRELARYAIGDMVVPPSGGAVGANSGSLNLEVLRAGNAHFESDEAVPASMAQQREYLQQMVTGMPPQVADMMGVFHPANIGVVRTLLGLSSLVVPGEYQREKTHELIGELLRAAPIEQDGAPPAPSIEPDSIEDDLSVSVGIIQEWMASPAGREQKKTNPDGFANVKAYLAAAIQMSAQPPGEGGPPQPGGPPPGGGGPPPPGPPTSGMDAPLQDPSQMDRVDSAAERNLPRAEGPLPPGDEMQ